MQRGTLIPTYTLKRGTEWNLFDAGWLLLRCGRSVAAGSLNVSDKGHGHKGRAWGG